ncbi:hypothetical protein ACQPZJ_29905 [Actinoplanes sp. CA-054009]
MRVDGEPSAGKWYVVVTKQQDAAYYFESKVERLDPGRWSAGVQLGKAQPTPDEDYAISVYEMDREWAAYLGTVLGNAVRDWDPGGETDATYWNTTGLPPGAGDPLHTINVHRAKKPDPHRLE